MEHLLLPSTPGRQTKTRGANLRLETGVTGAKDGRSTAVSSIEDLENYLPLFFIFMQSFITPDPLYFGGVVSFPLTRCC